MTERRPYDPEQDGPLISAYADGELDGEQRAMVESWLEMDERARRELDRIVQMKAFTDHLALRPAPHESWEGFHRKVYNRGERNLGWTLFWAGVGVVGLYVAVRLLVAIVALTVPILVRLGLLVAGAGLLVLMVSAIRERLYTRKRDRYDDVER